MDLHTGDLYWPTTCPRSTPANPLRESIDCDVLIIGAGVSGAMAACHLAREGLNVVVVDRRTISAGSTSASTAMVMYELDQPLVRLAGLLGSAHAAAAYRASRRAVDDLAALVDTLDDSCEHTLRRCLLLASKSDDVESLHEELEARRAIGIECELLDRETLQAVFGIRRPCALLSDGACEINPLRLTRALFRDADAMGVRIFDQTELSLPPGTRQPHQPRTADGHTITCDHMVIATGYETPEQFALVRGLTTLRSTYALVSAPVDTPLWPGRPLIWETAHPYCYLRTAPGNRVIIGGEDNALIDAAARDAHIELNTRRLVGKAADIIEGLKIVPEYAWAGTFAETPDALPLIGTVECWPGVHFALGYGGNGITFSLLAAQITRDAILNRSNDDAQTFSLERALLRQD